MLDARTIYFSYFLTNALITLVLIPIWYQNRKKFDGLSYWLIDYVLQTVALILIALRGSIPDVLSINLSNAMVITGIMVLYIGLEQFTGSKSSHVHKYLLLGLFLLFHLFYTHIDPSLPSRTIIISVFIACYSLLCAWLLLRRVEGALRSITRGTGLIFLCYACNALVRIVLSISFPQGSDLFQTTAWDEFTMIVFQLLNLALTYTLILMINGRLLAEVNLSAMEKSALAHQLNLRLKQLNSLYGISHLYERHNLPLPSLLQQIVTLLPEAFQHPEKSCARILHNTVEYQSPECCETRWKLSEPLKVLGEVVGSIDVFHCSDGDINSSPFLPEEERLLHVIAERVGRICERYQIEEALTLSEEKYRRLVENLGEGVSLVDANERFQFINSAGAAIFGLPQSDLIGRNLAHFTDPVMFTLVRNETAIRKLGKTSTYEIEIRRPDDQMRTLLVTANPHQDPAGNFLGTLGIFMDITGRKQAEREREETISKLEEALTKVKTLSGLLPICASCKKIRDDKGYWHQVEVYISKHSEADFSHSICPICMDRLYPELHRLKKPEGS